MNETLWNSVQKFDLDQPSGEYCFSIRLASENRWTEDFTEKAILEYKKFMYLAAVSDVMVSPSPIVDVVWHQHLIFSQSYHDFCDVLGKAIQHVPSTHHKSQFEQFKRAAEYTEKLYADHFAPQPESIWKNDTMLGSLKLEPAKIKTESLTLYGLLAFILLVIPFYYLLRPLYVRLDNPYFILGFMGLVLPLYVVLNLYNKNKIKQTLNAFNQDSFVYHLKPFELIYLKTGRLTDVISGSVNELIHNGTIAITGQMISVSQHVQVKSAEHAQIVSALQDSGRIDYTGLLRILESKPVFRNVRNSLDAFKYHVKQSKTFGKLFYKSFLVFALLSMFPLIRLITGIVRDKPVIQIVIILVVLLFFIFSYLRKLTVMLTVVAIPNWYENNIQYKRKAQEDWRWSYFLYGAAVLTPVLVPFVNNGRDGWTDGGSGDSGGGGSSCGSSCGSCGGCGGD